MFITRLIKFDREFKSFWMKWKFDVLNIIFNMGIWYDGRLEL